MENEADNVLRCPRCFARDVRPSRKGGFLDSVMDKFRRTPYRCRGCHNRFYVYVPRGNDEVEEPLENVDGETPQNQATPSNDEETHNSDVVKPAEP